MLYVYLISACKCIRNEFHSLFMFVCKKLKILLIYMRLCLCICIYVCLRVHEHARVCGVCLYVCVCVSVYVNLIYQYKLLFLRVMLLKIYRNYIDCM